jgi:hypothetical protein
VWEWEIILIVIKATDHFVRDAKFQEGGIVLGHIRLQAGAAISHNILFNNQG